MTVDPRSDRAIYRQVADILRAQIADGTLAPGTMLPSEKQLADTLAVGRDAVRQAIGVLRAEGTVQTTKGRGTLVLPAPERTPIIVPPGTHAIVRMPTDVERSRMGLHEGVPVISVTLPSGAKNLYAADKTYLVSGEGAEEIA